MKICAGKILGGRKAFTITETMIATAVFSLVIAVLLSSHLMGLRFFNLTVRKLSASAEARKALNAIRDDIRTAKTLYVGTGNKDGFSTFTNTGVRQGNALQIYPGTDTNVFVRYYYDGEAEALKRMSSGQIRPVTVAVFVTNQVPFRAEDYLGNALTNDQDNRVISMTLELWQSEYGDSRSQGGRYSEYYRLQTRASRRTIE